LLRLEGLGDEIESPESQRLNGALVGAVPSDDNYRQIGIDAPNDRESVVPRQPGHLEIQCHGIYGLGAKDVEGLFAALCGEDAIVSLEDQLESEPWTTLIVDY
jgi:hypothetical protein